MLVFAQLLETPARRLYDMRRRSAPTGQRVVSHAIFSLKIQAHLRLSARKRQLRLLLQLRYPVGSFTKNGSYRFACKRLVAVSLCWRFNIFTPQHHSAYALAAQRVEHLEIGRALHLQLSCHRRQRGAFRQKVPEERSRSPRRIGLPLERKRH